MSSKEHLYMGLTWWALLGLMACSSEAETQSESPVTTSTIQGETPTLEETNSPTPAPTNPPSSQGSASPTPTTVRGTNTLQTPSATETATPDAEARLCADMPYLSYETFGEGFMVENCQSCHASNAPNRYYAPESVYFDTYPDVWSWKERILARSTGNEPSMPPSGGVSEEDRLLLEGWLRCWATPPP